MAPFVFFAMAFLSGLTVCGIAGTAMELAAGRSLSFAEPFVSSRYVLRSLASSLAAGPYMLVNDALRSREAGGISRPLFAVCLSVAVIWILAAGTVVIDLALRGMALLS